MPMKKKTIVFAFFVIFILVNIVSCSLKEEYVVNEADQKMIIYNESEQVYKFEDVKNYLNENIEVTVFCQEFKIPYYKHYNEMYYTVFNTDDGLKLFVFDSNRKFINIRDITFSKDADETGIKALTKGININEVRIFDPNGQYDFMYHNWSDYPKISYHYFGNGKCYTIFYKDNVIEDIYEFTI